MKEKIHPQYKEATIVCACGETIATRSTKQNIHVEICSRCHPFFTGKQKLIDSAGRVDKFRKRYEKRSDASEKGKSKDKEGRKTVSIEDALEQKKADLEKHQNEG